MVTGNLNRQMTAIRPHLDSYSLSLNKGEWSCSGVEGISLELAEEISERTGKPIERIA